jgi:post-segregation antitoxin (ccd killing protein)
MTAPYNLGTRKRLVNLTLNEDPVARARGIAGNLSGLVESLLADCVARTDQARTETLPAVRSAVAKWNTFAAAHGFFSDDHSTL